MAMRTKVFGRFNVPRIVAPFHYRRFGVFLWWSTYLIHATRIVNAQTFTAAILLPFPIPCRHQDYGATHRALLWLASVFAHAFSIPQFTDIRTTGAVQRSIGHAQPALFGI